MDKRYQVFVSSTYEDLKSERAEVIQALLELDCMPAGMELFPASSEQQWSWIRKIIDESDYYLVIVGGRYGQIHPEKGISYTEMEYRYAIETDKPVVAFLHGEPDKILVGKSERSDVGKEKLEAFRKRCEQKLCKYWVGAADLGAKVSRSLTQLIKHEPAVGWIRANSVSDDTKISILELREENNNLREKIREYNISSTANSELAGGEDEYILLFKCEVQQRKFDKRDRPYWAAARSEWSHIVVTWNQIFRTLSPVLITGATQNDAFGSINRLIYRYFDTSDIKLNEDERIGDIKLRTECGEQIRMQLIVLGLIEVERHDFRQEWSLTEGGREKLVELSALKKGQSVARDLDSPRGDDGLNAEDHHLNEEEDTR